MRPLVGSCGDRRHRKSGCAAPAATGVRAAGLPAAIARADRRGGRRRSSSSASSARGRTATRSRCRWPPTASATSRSSGSPRRSPSARGSVATTARSTSSPVWAPLTTPQTVEPTRTRPRVRRPSRQPISSSRCGTCRTTGSSSSPSRWTSRPLAAARDAARWAGAHVIEVIAPGEDGDGPGRRDRPRGAGGGRGRSVRLARRTVRGGARRGHAARRRLRRGVGRRRAGQPSATDLVEQAGRPRRRARQLRRIDRPDQAPVRRCGRCSRGRPTGSIRERDLVGRLEQALELAGIAAAPDPARGPTRTPAGRPASGRGAPAICSFGRVVTIVNVRTTTSFAGSRQPAQSPARTSGRASARPIVNGCRRDPIRCHS